MDKSSPVNKKQSPSRKAYSIFGGIINLSQSGSSNVSGGGNGGKSTVVSSGLAGSRGNALVPASTPISGTSQDLQGSSSNVYTVTVTNTHNHNHNLNQSPGSGPGSSSSGGGGANNSTSPNPKTYVNLNSAIKKKKGVQSPSAISSVSNNSNSTGMGGKSTSTSSGGGGGGTSSSSTGPIGPAPRTISILTALNELAVSSDERRPNPGSELTSPQNMRRSSSGGGDGLISKSNPSHSSFQHPSRRHSTTTKAHGLSEATNLSFPSPPSASVVYHSGSGSNHHQHNHPSRGAYPKSSSVSVSVSGANSFAYNDQQQHHHHHSHGDPNIIPTPFSSSTSQQHHRAPNVNTLPSKLRSGNKSLVRSHKESLARKGGGKQRDRSKSRTPDWIWKIFQLTKLGKLEELEEALQGLDPTLIRHLTDARGNTLLHATVRSGHVRILKWLVSVLGSQCTEAALNDHNQAGRTVILTALKKGQLECLEWLVSHTKCGEKALVPNEGERSLLHFASIFGNVKSVRFLCTQLIDKGLSVDISDASGMTPLHDAAKSGNIGVCHELILAGADALSQTELGWRPSDLAIRHRHMECASYFMVAEAAASLGNQLHSLLLAFNHLRQEHEELRSHFRETLRVGKWLSKERNDLIKHFNSNWSPEGNSITASSMLLGGATTNGTRFSDMEHKLVMADQCWRKMSQNMEESHHHHQHHHQHHHHLPKDNLFSEEEQAQLSNISGQDFLNRRLAALQLRLERTQSVATSLSGSSDEDPFIENSSSSEDSSNSDLDVQRVTSITAGVSNITRSSPPAPPHQNPRPHPPSSSSSSSPPPPPLPPPIKSTTSSTSISTSILPHPSSHSLDKNRMSQHQHQPLPPPRSKAAPWLLPPNDLFLSQLSPFVTGSSCSPNSAATLLGKSLSTLDLLHGAPTSTSLMSPKSMPPTSLSSSAQTNATKEASGKNEKSLVHLEAEGHGRHVGKRDSTSLEISVLEVIEPTSSSHTTSPSTAKKKGEDRVEPSTPPRAEATSPPRPWLDLSVHHYENQSQSQNQRRKARGMVRHKCGGGGLMQMQRKTGSGPGEEANSTGGIDHAQAMAKDGRPGSRWMSTRPSSSATPVTSEVECGSAPGAGVRPCSTSSILEKRDENESRQMLPKSGNQAPDLICGMQYRAHGRRKSQPLSLIDRHHEKEDYYCETSSREKMIMERGEEAEEEGEDEGHYETIVILEDDTQRKSSLSVDELSRLDTSFKLKKDGPIEPRKDEGTQSPKKARGSKDRSSCPSPSLSLYSSTVRSHSSCESRDKGPSTTTPSQVSANSSSISVSAKSFPFRTRTPSPKSYVTRLTVIPVEPAETCFLSLKSNNTFVQPDPQTESDSQLPGENQDDIGLSQIPCDSVSSTNTPVMPRFNSSGSVVFPLRKPEWNSSELLSFPTPDSSLAGRLSPTPSEASRTESALAPPPSYISHVSQNSELSKTESQRGQVVEEEEDLESENHPHQDDHDARATSISPSEYLDSDNPPPLPFHPPPTSNQHQSTEASDLSTKSVSYSHQKMEETAHSSSSSLSPLSPTNRGDYVSGSCGGKDDNPDHDSGDDPDESKRKPPSSRLLSKQRFQTTPLNLLRSFAGSTAIHKSPHHHHHHHQRLPKGHRGHHSRPWYEIEGSDDEGSLLRVTTKRSNSSNSRSSTSSNSSPTDHNAESRHGPESDPDPDPDPKSDPESEGNGRGRRGHNGPNEDHDETHVKPEDEKGGQRKVSQEAESHHHYHHQHQSHRHPERDNDDDNESPTFL